MTFNGSICSEDQFHQSGCRALSPPPFCDSSHYPRPLVDNFSSCQGKPGAETWIQSKAKLKQTLWQVDEIKCNSGVGPSNRHEHIVQDFIMLTLPAASDMLTWLGNQQKDFFCDREEKKGNVLLLYKQFQLKNSNHDRMHSKGHDWHIICISTYLTKLFSNNNKKKFKWVYNFDAKPSFNLVFRLFFQINAVVKIKKKKTHRSSEHSSR